MPYALVTGASTGIGEACVDAKLAGHVVTRLPDAARDAFSRFGARRWETRGRKLRRGA